MKELSRAEISADKKSIATKMLRQSKSNAEINEVIVKKYETGISGDTLAVIRIELGTPGRNSKRAAKRKAKVKRSLAASALVLKSNGGSPAMQTKLQGLLSQMRRENVGALTIKEDGFVQYQQSHEILLEAAS